MPQQQPRQCSKRDFCECCTSCVRQTHVPEDIRQILHLLPLELHLLHAQLERDLDLASCLQIAFRYGCPQSSRPGYEMDISSPGQSACWSNTLCASWLLTALCADRRVFDSLWGQAVVLLTSLPGRTGH